MNEIIFDKVIIKPWIGKNYHHSKLWNGGRLLVIATSNYDDSALIDEHYIISPDFQTTVIERVIKGEINTAYFRNIYAVYKAYLSTLGLNLVYESFWQNIAHYDLIHNKIYQNGRERATASDFNEDVLSGLLEVLIKLDPKYIVFHSPQGWSMIKRSRKGLGKNISSSQEGVFQINNKNLGHHYISRLYHPSARFFRIQGRQVPVTEDLYVEKSLPLIVELLKNIN